MAHKKGVGSSRNGRDSNAQRLGVKRLFATANGVVAFKKISKARSIVSVLPKA
ncbi:MAG: Ribosomal protein [Bacteroidetes bacterium]|nr:Ribosomal protein [Bacteroidota bacterium]